MGKHARGRQDADAPFSLDSGETPGTRALRLEHLLFEELYRLFRMEVNDPRLSELVPTSVQMSPDLRNAKVMYALRDELASAQRGEPKKAVRGHSDPRMRAVQEALLRVTPFLRTRLTDSVSMKRLPELHFHRDRVAESTLRAEQLLTGERLAAVRQAAAAAEPDPQLDDMDEPDESRAAAPEAPRPHQ
jgi:ribosome-binding factor A